MSGPGGEPLVSVVMPACNLGDILAEAIESVRRQSVEDWELLVVDDASDDDTPAIAERFARADARIRLLRLAENSGPAAARNAGLAAARGRCVAFLDGDDLWRADKLERQLAFMRSFPEGECRFCCTAYSQIGAAGEPLGLTCFPPARTGYWKCFFLSNPIGNSTVLYDRSFYPDVRVPDIRKRNDFALWLRLLRGGGRCYGMQEALTQYRVRGGSLSAQKLSLARYHWQLYRQVEGRSLFVSALGMLGWAVVKGTGLGLRRKRGRVDA